MLCVAAGPARGGAKPFYGICYGPFRGAQSPERGAGPSREQIAQDLERLRQVTDRIRIYGTRRWGRVTVEEAARLGFREILLGIWLGRDREGNERELQAALGLARRHLPGVSLLVVGNEVLLRGDLSPQELAATMRKVRSATGLPVAYADTAATWLRADAGPVVQQADVLLVHLHPFWEGVPMERAPDQFAARLAAVRTRHPGKPLRVGETGWPERGAPVGRALPSPANQARWLSFVLRRAHKDRIFYFEAFDEPWKAAHEGGERGAAWGIWTAAGKIRPALVPVLRATGVDPAELRFPRPR